MKRSAAAACLAFALLIPSSDRVSAQSEGSDVQVTGGVSTASFTTPEGKIQVHVSSDAAPGDTLSGVVLAEPAGKTPQEQQANLGTLSGLVVELEGQQTKVASKQYEWTVPAALRVRARDSHAAATGRPDGVAGAGSDRSAASASPRHGPDRCRAAVRPSSRPASHDPRPLRRFASWQDHRCGRRSRRTARGLSKAGRLPDDAADVR